jgi:serine/threonine-protein kinase
MRSVRPDVPEALEAVILTALQKDRVGRYPTAADMQRALLPFVEANAAPLISLAAEVTRYDAPTPAGRFGGITADDLIPLPGGQNASTDMSWESGKGASRRKLGLWLGLGAGAAVLFLVVFAGVFFAFHKSGDRASPPPHPTVASSPATPASPPPVVASSPANSASPSPIVSQPPVQLPAPAVAPDPASDIVTITLRGVPEGAAVYLDDAQVDGTELRLRRSSEMRRVRVEQPGFEPWSHMITAEQDATHEVRLVSREQEPEARDPAPQGRHVERRQPQRPEETSRPRPPASPPVNHGWGGDQGFQREF